jgi:HSP20 family protein
MQAPMKRNQSVLFPSLNTFFDDVFDRGFFDMDKSFAPGKLPATNIREEDEAYLIEVAAPGMKKDDFKIEVHKGQLFVSSERKESREEKDEEGNYTHREFYQSSFRRTFQLPDHINPQAIKASYTDGILALRLPKVEKAEDKLLIDIS